MVYHNHGVRNVIDKATKKKTKENARAVESNSGRLSELEKKVEELSLMNESLWQLLKQETRLTDEDFDEQTRLVHEKNIFESNMKVECTNCNQKLPLKETRCYYCGSEVK